MIRTEALRVFVTVAEFGNIREAAARLFRTQSAISMTLKQVEDHLGAPLFESDRKQTLTELGQQVFGVARAMLRDHDRAIALIEDYALGRNGTLRIASVPSVAALLIPEMLGDFLAQRPAAEIDLVDTDSVDVRRLVASGQADLGIASADEAQVGLQFVPVFEDEMWVVCRKDAPLAQIARPLGWQDLEGVPMILNETTRGIAAPAFQDLAAQTKLRVRNVTSLLAMVRAGVGITLLPGLATVGLGPHLVTRPLNDASCRRSLCLVRRAGRVQSPLAQAFEQDFIATVARLAGQFGLQGPV